MAKTGKKRGRPTDYNQEIANLICQRIAEGESLRKICREDDMPDKSTVLKWLLSGKHPEFIDQYALSRQIQAELRVDSMLDIATDCPPGNDYVSKAKLQIDTIKWESSKLLPKKYGDKVQHEAPDGFIPVLIPDVSKKSDD